MRPQAAGSGIASDNRSSRHQTCGESPYHREKREIVCSRSNQSSLRWRIALTCTAVHSPPRAVGILRLAPAELVDGVACGGIAGRYAGGPQPRRLRRFARVPRNPISAGIGNRNRLCATLADVLPSKPHGGRKGVKRSAELLPEFNGSRFSPGFFVLDFGMAPGNLADPCEFALRERFRRGDNNCGAFQTSSAPRATCLHFAARRDATRSAPLRTMAPSRDLYPSWKIR
jgi:hypothetical protein